MQQSTGRTPLLIGVTGHRALRPADLTTLRHAVRRQLIWMRSLCPHAPMVMLNGLAEGADQLCAREALYLRISLTAVLPWPADVFRGDFSGEALASFDELLAACDGVMVAPSAEPFRDTPEYAYRQVGLYIARHCHVLLALSDGGPPKQDGCGTAETIAFLQYRAGQDSCYDDAVPPGESALLKIHAPRRDGPWQGKIDGAARLEEWKRGALEATLARIEAANAPQKT